MNLIVDQGNTFVKYGVFRDKTLVKQGKLEFLDSKILDNLHLEHNIDRVMFSSVGSGLSDIRLWCQNHEIPFLKFSLELTLPLPIDYRTPETLGLDRVAAVIGAYECTTAPNFLVIDAGTAITYEFVVDNVYKGGNISPGLQTRFKALHDYTEKLPLVEAAETWTNWGKTTFEAIRNGVQEGLLLEIEGYISGFISKYEDPTLFLTGGDSIFFANKLKNSIFADQHLVLYGLNRVLLDNVKD